MIKHILSVFAVLFCATLIHAQYWNGSVGINSDIFRTGKVLIATTNVPTTFDVGGEDISDYKLFVCGGILADEWMVPNADWCDYVFDAGYTLLPLKQVEAYINEHGHLHNTPSAAEIKEGGLKMNEITLNQQEKIEEIFLHLIEMEKKLDALQEENEALKQELETLKQER